MFEISFAAGMVTVILNRYFMCVFKSDKGTEKAKSVASKKVN